MERLKCKVVMLPTNEKAISNQIVTDEYKHLNICTKRIRGFGYDDESECTVGAPQHLYFTSKRKIKEGDWFIVNLFNVENVKSTVVEQCKWIKDGIWVNGMGVVETRHIENCQKIESATDLSLNLPLIPQSFVEKYVQKQGDIGEVEIEMDVFDCTANGVQKHIVDVKTRSDNTVITHKVKDTWTREEVIVFLGKMIACNIIKPVVEAANFDQWIEENL